MRALSIVTCPCAAPELDRQAESAAKIASRFIYVPAHTYQHDLLINQFRPYWLRLLHCHH